MNGTPTYDPPRERSRNGYSLALSLAIHTLLGILLVWTWRLAQNAHATGEPLRPAGIVLTLKSEDALTKPKQKYLTESDLIEQSSEVAQTPPPASMSAPPPLDVKERKDSEGIGRPDVDSLVLDANSMFHQPAASSQVEFELSEEDLKMIEADRKLLAARQPVGNPTTIGLFGMGGLTGRSFVFVLDRSHSMGGSGLGVIQASRAELTQAISKLEPHHKFQIVAYHNRTATLSVRNLLPATEANKRQVAGFIDGLAAFGGTKHEHGLVAALAFQPDVIVLMTDGGPPELNGGQLKRIQQMAGGKTQIHCLQFGIGPRQGPPGFMVRLAEQNGGTYRYIDVNQWKREP